jgi:hypothetical protein
MNDFKTHANEINDHINNTIEDIKNNHIDPNRVWNNKTTGGQIATAIGLVLGGFNPTARPNAAMEFFQKQIDNDIKAQELDLNNKHSLLNAYYHQYGNLKDATDMTRLTQAAIIADKLNTAAANATSPIAAARAKQQAADIQMQMAPLANSMAMRRTLMSVTSGQGAGSNEKAQSDPAQFIPFLVPKEHQEATYKEVSRAQDTRKVADSALKNYDAVAEKMRSMGGLGRAGVAAYSPAELHTLQAELGTTVGDMEGSVREMAMNNVKGAYMPQPTDTDARLAARRKGLEEYLKLKSSAPRAKSFGIDLDKFGSTTRQMPAPQEDQRLAQYEAWAKANPNDPRAQAILNRKR